MAGVPASPCTSYESVGYGSCVGGEERQMMFLVRNTVASMPHMFLNNMSLNITQP